MAVKLNGNTLLHVQIWYFQFVQLYKSGPLMILVTLQWPASPHWGVWNEKGGIGHCIIRIMMIIAFYIFFPFIHFCQHTPTISPPPVYPANNIMRYVACCKQAMLIFVSNSKEKACSTVNLLIPVYIYIYIHVYTERKKSKYMAHNIIYDISYYMWSES